MKVAKLIVFFLLSLLATTVFGYSNHGYDYKVTSGCTTTILKVDAYGFYQNNCTSYVAYMLNTFGIKFTNGYLGANWSHGKTWGDAAGNISGQNIPVDNHPLPGDVAYWTTGGYGHVAWVEKVNFDSSGNAISVDITEYNFSTPCGFGQRTVPVNNPDGYIHILAFNEGVVSLYYLDCYEMGSLCDTQTHQEWRWIVERVANYRCTTCVGKNQEVANAFYNSGGFGGSDTPNPPYITGGKNVGDLPDLIVHELYLVRENNRDSPHLNEIHVGQQSYCNIQVKNVGNAGAWGTWANRCYLSKGNWRDHDPNNLGHESMTDLTTGQSRRVYQVIPAFEYPGRFNITACADIDNDKIKESDEGDNCYNEVAFNVVSNPDLVMSSVTLGGGKTTLIPNEVFSVNAVIANAGENFGDAILIGYYLDDMLIGTNRINRENLKGGVSKTETLSKIVAPGTLAVHTLKVCADYDNRVQEVNENNNCLLISVPVFEPTSPPNPALKKTSPAVLELLFN